MKAVGYARVSTGAQAREGVSLEAQKHRFKAWCRANGHELVEVESDEGISGGKTSNRPGLQTLLLAHKQSHFCRPLSSSAT